MCYILTDFVVKKIACLEKAIETNAKYLQKKSSSSSSSSSSIVVVVGGGGVRFVISASICDKASPL